jgi:hypothetical protein
METRAFFPLYGPVQGAGFGSLLPSTTIAASVAAATNAAAFSGTTQNQYVQLQIANQTGAWAFLNFGVFGNVTAATVATGFPVAPGAVIVVSVAPEVTAASVILAAGATAGNVTITRGEGV